VTDRVDAEPRCPVCRGASEPHAVAHDVEYHTTDEPFAYRRCTACGSVFLHPPPTDRLAEIYPPNYYAYTADDESVVERAKRWLDRRTFRPLLRSVPGEELAVLDVGGGDGWLLSRLRQLDDRITSTQVVDLDPAAEAGARARGHEYFCGRIEDFDDPGPYDVVLLLNLVEHVADPGAVLQRLANVLSPRGVILVKTPNVDSLDARIFRRRDWGGYHCPRHWVLFNRESFVALAARAGLDPRRVAYTQGAPFWTVSMLALLQRRGVVRITADRPVVDHPLFGPLLAVFGTADLVRGRFGARTSQMFVELTHAPAAP
jgi:SAM-dependent methyltransferase